MGLWNSLGNLLNVNMPNYSDSGELNKSMNQYEDIMKSERARDPKFIIEDPLSMLSQLGFKDKPSTLTFDTLKKMAVRNSVVASIITTRVNQVASFSQPARFTKDGVGFEITLRDPNKSPTKEEMSMILSLESFIENCGFTYDPARDNFDTFLRKITRDSLTYDQLNFETVPDRRGLPAEIYAVDASTIRAAEMEDPTPETGVTFADFRGNSTENKFVQVLNGTVIAEFTGLELAFAVRNPRTDINIQPYGHSELEILIHQITAHLWAEEYNSKYFSQGGTTKGILNIKGQNISKEQLDAFRRQWTAQIAGMTGAWKTPVVSVDGLEYVNVSQSNREMEYEMWMNYLINICCAVYQIDPAEINFPNRGGAGGSGGGLGEGGIEDRLKNSKDKGLRPMLSFLANVINRYIVRRFSNKFVFNFVGLDKESEKSRLEVQDKQVRSFKTINELRKQRGMEPLENGDVILDPTYINYVMQKEMAEQAEQQGDPNDPNAGAGEEPQEEQSPEEVQQAQEDDQIHQSIDQQYGQ